MKDAGYLTYHHGKRGNTALNIQAKFEINQYLANDLEDRTDGEPGRTIVDDAISFLKNPSSAFPDASSIGRGGFCSAFGGGTISRAAAGSSTSSGCRSSSSSFVSS